MSDDEYDIPLQDQGVFGAGLKRKRIHFVPSSSSSIVVNPSKTPAGSTSVGDRYLSLVLSQSTDDTKSTLNSSPTTLLKQDSSTDTATALICEICSLLISSDTTKSTHHHEATLAHQLCLEHSYPPSNIDRSRLGLRYLQSQGWDPDSRVGLGAHGQGIQFPIKSKPKNDKLGLGLVLPSAREHAIKEDIRERLDAGQVRKLQEKDRRKKERLQELFYRSEELDKYLGSC